MSLLSRLKSRAGVPGAARTLRPKGLAPLRREEVEEAAQPLRRAPAPATAVRTILSRMEEEEVAQAIRREEDEEESMQPLRREEEEEEAQPLRRQPEEEEDSLQTIRREKEEEAMQPLRRDEEEEAAQPLRREPEEEEETLPLRRLEEEEEAMQTLRRQPEEEEESLQTLRREEEEEAAQPLRRLEEEAMQTLRRMTPPDAEGLDAETAVPPDDLSGEPDVPSASPMRREAAPQAAFDMGGDVGIDAAAPDFPEFDGDRQTATHGTDPGLRPGAETAIPPGPAKVVIDQVDVVIHEPGQPARAGQGTAQDFARFARSRYLGGL
ncbi:hypothetical protein [Mesobacterium pallidum]|uniref:hypothetical protein n=1 Tax=Mesobacterium pallidum TaxID=2872037 RepID=UPI001EE29784|nr:hypothetical protein [Mesobacterium pallidum]